MFSGKINMAYAFCHVNTIWSASRTAEPVGIRLFISVHMEKRYIRAHAMHISLLLFLFCSLSRFLSLFRSDSRCVAPFDRAHFRFDFHSFANSGRFEVRCFSLLLPPLLLLLLLFQKLIYKRALFISSITKSFEFHTLNDQHVESIENQTHGSSYSTSNSHAAHVNFNCVTFFLSSYFATRLQWYMKSKTGLILLQLKSHHVFTKKCSAVCN